MADTIPPEQLRDHLDAGEEFALVDTRVADDFAEWRIPGAVNYPFMPDEGLDPAAFREETGVEPGDRVVTVCAKGISSYAFADALSEAGYGDVAVVEDGMEGWSAVYDVAEVGTRDPAVEIRQVQRRAKGCLGYVVASPATGEAAVVDPTRHVGQFLRVASEAGYEVTRVLDTHVHADHISGGRELADAAGVPYHLGAGAVDRGVEYDYEPLGRNEVVEVGTVDIKAVFTPGHTSEMVSYLVAGEALLTGDTLFVDSVGRTELQFAAGAGDDGSAGGAGSVEATGKENVESEDEESVEATGEESVEATGEENVESEDEESVEATGEENVEATGEESVESEDEESVEATGEESVEATGEENVEAAASEGARSLWASLHRTILAEPDAVSVLPGHFTVTETGETPEVTPGEPVVSTVGRRRTDSDLLGLPEAEFVERIVADLPDKPPNYETIIDVNTGRTGPGSEQRAVELELGPNRCAAGGEGATGD